MKTPVLLLVAVLIVGSGSVVGVGPFYVMAAGNLDAFPLDSQQLLAQARGGLVRMALPVATLDLQLAPNPMAEGAVWGLDGAAFGTVTETVTFKGLVNGAPVRLAATEAGVFVAVFDEDPLFVVPAWIVRSGLPFEAHVALRWSVHPARIAPHEEPASPYGFPAGPSTLDTAPANRVVDLLIEEDAALYEKSSVLGTCDACWVQVQQAIMNVVEQLFEPQTGVSFRITSQWACTSVAACPYAGNSAAQWLGAFGTRWENIQGEPSHHLGHLMSGTNFFDADGLAMGAGVNTPLGYALSEFAANLSPFTTSLFLNFITTAHELGHNFNAVHAEADPIPPTLVPTGATGHVYTIMQPGELVHYQFSDGTWNPSHNNVARIVAHALQQLPP